MNRSDTEWVDDVLRFWFAELTPKEWWKGADVDARVRARFAPLLDALAGAPPDAATLDARGHVATVIVFDQFPRNLFRGTADAFATDALALRFALDAVERRLDEGLPAPQRQFLYMPLMHSEDLAMQRRSLALFASLADARELKSAREHHDTIARFGRFPSRNAALGRESTDDERAFLASLAQRRRP